MDFQDRPIQCIDCGQDFVFTAGEQQFYERKGFREVPKRCKACRELRKNRRDGAAQGGGNEADGNRAATGNRGAGGFRDHGGGGGGGGQREARELFQATCAACGSPAKVPFRPAAGRPVYCKECYANRAPGSGGY